MVGGHAWLPGGMHGCREVCGCGGACMVGGHAWLLGGMHGCQGVHGCRGHVWLPGGCAWLPGGMRGIRRDTVNERAVRILLECILVLNKVLCLSYIFLSAVKERITDNFTNLGTNGKIRQQIFFVTKEFIFTLLVLCIKAHALQRYQCDIKMKYIA